MRKLKKSRTRARRNGRGSRPQVSLKGWRTTDTEEIERRKERAQAEPMAIVNEDPAERFFSTFSVASEVSGMRYRVEIRSLTAPENSCTCPDFRVNGLGTCKHIEAVLAKLRGRPRLFRQASVQGSPKAEIYLRRQGTPAVCISLPQRAPAPLRRLADRFFDSSGQLLGAPENAVPALTRAVAALPQRARTRVRIADEVTDWVSYRTSEARRRNARRLFERDLRNGKRTVDLLRCPLYPYQIEGMLHLVFGERVLLADDMGLGKTVQAIAACALLKEIRSIARVLVVCPASLKTEWEAQIGKFTELPVQLIMGLKHKRSEQYRGGAFFFIANYEQVLRDVVQINEILAPDVIILDEAQRIKNWGTKTAQAVKRLSSPYAFVLTGTPLENRIDEIYSIVEFLDPHIFGPLFRFNREFYRLDERGRPVGYKNLPELRRRIKPIMLRRRRKEVETQLPKRLENNFFVGMTEAQFDPYQKHEATVASLMKKAEIRPLTKEEHERLQIALACMRMLCDSPYILDLRTKVSPKLDELQKVLEDVGVLNGRKAIIFSEWRRMLELVQELAEKMRIDYALHAGDVPQKKRRQEILRFKNDPRCKLFLSTDSGGVGLNLQSASVVVNLDLPWNPAKLEQRIARAWRKHQRSVVNVINFVSRGTIEHRMLSTLSMKRELFEGLIEGRGDLRKVGMPSGRQAFLNRLRLVMGTELPAARAPAPAEQKVHAAPRERFRQELLARLPGRVHLIQVHGAAGTPSSSCLVVVDRKPDQVAAVVRRIWQDACGRKTAGAVEVLDRKTYQTLQRLSRRGLLLWEEKNAEELHRSPSLPRTDPDPAEERRRCAADLCRQAERKLAMGKVLREGGFPKEALAPVREALEMALKAVATAAGWEAAQGNEHRVPTSFLHSRLLADKKVTPQEAAWISTLRELDPTEPDLHEGTAARLVTRATQTCEKFIQAVAQQHLRA